MQLSSMSKFANTLHFCLPCILNHQTRVSCLMYVLLHLVLAVSLFFDFIIYLLTYFLFSQIIDPTVLIDTFMHVITMENRSFTKASLDGIEVLIDSLHILRGTKVFLISPYSLLNTRKQKKDEGLLLTKY